MSARIRQTFTDEPHCRSCTCYLRTPGAERRDAPGYRLVVAVERAWSELMAEDRAAGRPPWRHGPVWRATVRRLEGAA